MTTPRGRTPADPLTPISLSITVSISHEVAAYAAARGISKAEAFRSLIRAGLAANPDGQLDGQTTLGGD